MWITAAAPPNRRRPSREHFSVRDREMFPLLGTRRSSPEPDAAGLVRRARYRGAEQIVGVDDPVGVTLLGQEPLAVGGVVGVQGVP